MSGKRFRYALEPLLVTRRWLLDDVLAELAEHNTRIAGQRAGLKSLEDDLTAARRHAQAGQAAGADLQPTRLALLGRYLYDGAHRKADMEERLATMERERDETTHRAVAARRRLEAVEEHRDEQRLAFWRARAGLEWKAADDHWNILQAKKEEHGFDR